MKLLIIFIFIFSAKAFAGDNREDLEFVGETSASLANSALVDATLVMGGTALLLSAAIWPDYAAMEQKIINELAGHPEYLAKNSTSKNVLLNELGFDVLSKKFGLKTSLENTKLLGKIFSGSVMVGIGIRDALRLMEKINPTHTKKTQSLSYSMASRRTLGDTIKDLDRASEDQAQEDQFKGQTPR